MISPRCIASERYQPKPTFVRSLRIKYANSGHGGAAEVCVVSFVLPATSWFHIAFSFTLPTTTPINICQDRYGDNKAKPNLPVSTVVLRQTCMSTLLDVPYSFTLLIIGRPPRTMPSAQSAPSFLISRDKEHSPVQKPRTQSRITPLSSHIFPHHPD